MPLRRGSCCGSLLRGASGCMPKAAEPATRWRPRRCVVYSLDGGNPLFFDPDGRGGLLPTVRLAGLGAAVLQGPCYVASLCPLTSTQLLHGYTAGQAVHAHPRHRQCTTPTLPCILPMQVYALAVLPQLLPTLHTWSEVGLLCCTLLHARAVLALRRVPCCAASSWVSLRGMTPVLWRSFHHLPVPAGQRQGAGRR